MMRDGGGITGEPHWGGTALLRPGVLAFTGSIGTTDLHAHHAVQIVTATTPFTMRDEHGNQHRGTKVVVPADAPHRVEVGAPEGTVVFLEPESAPGRSAHLRALRSGWTVAPVLTFTRADRAAQLITGPYRQVMIEDAGHWLQQERPDEVNRVLLDFLAGLQ